jgi:hypothetical protein
MLTQWRMHWYKPLLQAKSGNDLASAEILENVVKYSLSPLGVTLIPLMATLRQWAEEHMEEVEQARQAYGEKEEKACY